MRRTLAVFGVFLGLMMALPAGAAQREPSANTKSAVVMIALYDNMGGFIGWGSGFFVDEGIIVTNKHVMEGGYYYRIFATGADDAIDLKCYETIKRSGLKLNLEDDVAYMRVYLDCPHGTVYFADRDPKLNDPMSILGYPQRNGSLKDSLGLYQGPGKVTSTGDGEWMRTDAFLDFGNSGGPVVKDDLVVGVAVAKRVDSDGTYISGLFIPVSVIVKGLENANDSAFGYTPQRYQNNPAYKLQPVVPTTDAECVDLMGEGAKLADNGGCKCVSGYKKDPSGSQCVSTAPKGSKSSSSNSSAKSVKSSSQRSVRSSSTSSRRSRVRSAQSRSKTSVRSATHATSSRRASGM